MRIRADFGVGHPAAEVWALLAGPDGVLCVPGLTVAGPGPGTLELDVEARHLVFEGSAAAASDPRARTVTVEAKGIERNGRGKGRVVLLVKVAEDGLFSTVEVEADLHLSGEVGAEARLIAEQVYRLADRVAECLEARLGSAMAAPPAATPAPSAAPGDTVEAGGAEGPRWFGRLLRRLGRGG